jgi:ATP-dependent DNA helicase RecG
VSPAVRAGTARRGAQDSAPVDSPEGLRLLRGVGPARAQKLAAAGIATPRDLLLFLPVRLDEAPAAVPIAKALRRPGALLRVAGRVRSWRFSRFGRRSLLRVTLADGSGSADALFFNQPWLRERFSADLEIELLARVVDAKGPALAALKLGSALQPLPAPGALTAVYAAPAGLSSEMLAGLVRAALECFAGELGETLPRELLARLELPELGTALRDLHLPRDAAVFEAARRRVFFEVLLGLQTRAAERRGAAGGRARVLELSPAQRSELTGRFPFELTGAQSAAIDDLALDLARPVPMRRLLQGDVGSGKTAVGAWACLAAARGGAQAAFLAPTELLAEQHLAALEPLFSAAGVRTVLLTGSLPAARRALALKALAAGAAQVAFGTHALFGAEVRFANLALAVIDEQHRFGVTQRRRLLDKGRDVHALLMTATPIPRSLALTIYGDLDVSLIAEKPPGRGQVRTKWVRGTALRKLRGWLAEQLDLGAQIYWVVPRIEESQSGAEGATQRFLELSGGDLARHGIELVHGRLDAGLRAQRLARFRAGQARLLVATTLIEVGVDVPAATVMVIEEAQRLGLAQLHQLRGRVGRGSAAGWCLLLGSTSGKERFELLERSNDGFALAEEDLRRRGMGDLLGLRQAGSVALAPGAAAPPADLLERDLDLLFAARELVRSRTSNQEPGTRS